MQVLWERERATVGDVVQALEDTARLAYNTVLTTLRILEQKGYVTHDKEGRAFVYSPLVKRHEARRQAVRHLLGRLFEDSPKLLLLNVLNETDVEPGLVARLKHLIEDEGRDDGKDEK
jgi:predicted transcriptional regulator